MTTAYDPFEERYWTATQTLTWIALGHPKTWSDRQAGGIYLHETEEDIQIKEANTKLLVAIRDEKLIAYGFKGLAPGILPAPLDHRMGMVAICFRADQTIADPDAAMKDFVHALRLPVYYKVYFEKAAILRLWPGRRATVAAETQLKKWLESQMRAAPNAPPGKVVMMARANAAGFTASSAGFNRAWATAVKASEAASWSKAGPRSKSRNRSA